MAQLIFPRPTGRFGSFGRNGWLITTGLDLNIVGGAIVIHPITTRGRPSSACQLGIPRENIPALIQILETFR
jgi:hypothetical protein